MSHLADENQYKYKRDMDKNSAALLV